MTGYRSLGLFPPDAVWIVLAAIMILVAATADVRELRDNTRTNVNASESRNASVNGNVDVDRRDGRSAAMAAPVGATVATTSVIVAPRRGPAGP